MATVKATQITADRIAREEQAVLRELRDELAHVFEAGEPLTKAARRLVKQGLVTMAPLPGRKYAVRLRLHPPVSDFND